MGDSAPVVVLSRLTVLFEYWYAVPLGAKNTLVTQVHELGIGSVTPGGIM